MWRFLPVFLVVGCYHSFSMTEQQARAGYVLALNCIGAEPVPTYDEIKRKIVKGSAFRFENDTGTYIGYALTASNTVLIAHQWRDHFRLWAHEYLHIFGKTKADSLDPQVAHPDSLFKRCNL